MISLERARELAYDWHSGGGSPLYSFASTSHDKPRNITDATIAEISGDIDSMQYNIARTDAPLAEWLIDLSDAVLLREYLLANKGDNEQ